MKELTTDCLLLPNKTLFVLNDPIGKESFDEIAYDAWIQREEKLTARLKTVKVLMQYRKYILSDVRITGILRDKSCLEDTNDYILKMNYDEKQTIFDRHSKINIFSKEELAGIIKIDAYFPLLCKLYFSDVKYQNDELRFINVPVVVLEEEIRNFRKSSKYCALVLVLFDNILCVNNLIQD